MSAQENHFTQKANPHLRRIELLSYLLDGCIKVPGTTIKVGLDPIIGLLPGVGDVVGGWASLYLVYLAARAGLPSMALIRMIGNVLVDVIIGAIPVFGDLFDFGWKVNLRNLALVDRYISRDPGLTSRSARDVSTMVVLLIASVAVGLVAILVLIVWALEKLVSLS